MVGTGVDAGAGAASCAGAMQPEVMAAAMRIARTRIQILCSFMSIM